MISPNAFDIKFWLGESLEDHGFTLFSDTYSFHGNLPGLHAIGPDGTEWDYNNGFHCWAVARHSVPECDRVYRQDAVLA